jgi:hypothetical protein
MNNLMEYSLQIRESPVTAAHLNGVYVWGMCISASWPSISRDRTSSLPCLNTRSNGMSGNLGLCVDCGSVHQEMRELDMAMEMCCAMTSS